ncbi:MULTISPECIES: peptide chain release factor N(5)-glutamine methyltransferase [Stenotrophomonas maltophilia group]|uniref:peptide chain release factor N(5)-glutamine methyltransferase n=1 Tax=Stenotrophomonas maltophilia group TaxID=995085 RepID=UPI0015DD873E|nr:MULTISPECIES: peptide chain release factor N(5)-glutamine methyltransferase [Stenotrophomonas maltophilia group]ELK6804543.1 peptide chain release factor N(5)-glutamine methyltransferase [Stenotrophomonas maltophilia]MBA0402161.1 peptide chain release factor N(5)-glutamine methyltransferase [Stenotrophomonas maltophilia]MCU1195521.1 peptide chain release factor N(5)-glutamine methyltransferase [Stenotrophomonas maltophilia]QNA94872.1 peptide chain release factor N(5)-glutamine methyltransfer
MPFKTEPSLRQVVAEASARLGGIDARHEAELLLLHVLDRPRSWLFAHATDPLAADDQAAFETLLARRVAGEPVAYLTGRRGFWTLDLEVDPATLIPRPETELLVELALERLPPDQALQLADLGTGSGAIALALASERPRAQVLATDASTGALAVAARNAARHELGNVRFAEGGHDWYAPLQGVRFDLIASNPPYIASDDPHLEQGDLRFEPSTALASGMDGLDDIRRIVDGGQAHLRPGGWLLIEHGWEQGAAIRALFEATGFVEVQTVQDLEQRDRITLGRRPA